MKENKEEYRNLLISTEQKSQEAYDKTILYLSGGALGISFVFMRDIIGENPIILKGCLFGSWICWSLSVTSVLASFYFSRLALRRAIKQLDQDKIQSEKPGGWLDCLTGILNFSGGALFLAGLVSIIIFASKNVR